MTTPTTDIVLMKVRQIFPNDDPTEILAILNLYGTDLYEGGRERIYLAALKLSDGNKDKLLSAIRLAKEDFRDVVIPAEYPGLDKIGFTEASELDAEGKRKLIEQDLHQYLSWLQDTDEPDMGQYLEELKDPD